MIYVNFFNRWKIHVILDVVLQCDLNLKAFKILLFMNAVAFDIFKMTGNDSSAFIVI